MEEKSILFVDDENEIRFSLSVIFKRKGYKVETAPNGFIALQIILLRELSGNPFDLLVCDLQMPQVNGEELLLKLKDLCIFIPTIVMTAYGTKDILRHFMSIGCLSFIDKPFQLEELEKAAVTILNGSSKEYREIRRLQNIEKLQNINNLYVKEIEKLLEIGNSKFEELLSNFKKSDSLQGKIRSVEASIHFASELCKKVLKSDVSTIDQNRLTVNMNELISETVTQLQTCALEEMDISYELSCSDVNIKAKQEEFKLMFLIIGLNSLNEIEDSGYISYKVSKIEKEKQEFIKILIKERSSTRKTNDLQDYISKGSLTKIFNEDCYQEYISPVFSKYKILSETKTEKGLEKEITVLVPLK